ncbi:interleukin-18 receptor accessory protein [Eublepharis macularius]|uniref:Interleukin-18 receptor accessory protein n=1 Tax=Eublepharis macularius TaxID=481883 RepID=A0AA97J480_EUBMA|nr:interleukin-18 receptor accessory protein [Eublepharis macularius]XP_054831110.1 interleukin-18 receptor accessory protein [Eublepharis macularius]XP_054831111.1 interleukin-18 receptor accessory protein [Eublepharis macularius]XP_054831112.1 interleukin-18 receptor accessory protein [Eublepharis macularius]
MLEFCWLFLLLMNSTEATNFNSGGCHQKHVDVRYRAISGQKFVLPCDLLPEDPASIFNHSCHHNSKVQWSWHSSDGKTRKMLSSKNGNPTYCGNVLWFKPIKVQDSGTYICTNRGKIPCISIFVDVQTKEMANCTKNFRSDLRLIVENGESVACPGKSCFSHFHSSTVKWYKNGKRVKLQMNRWGLKLQHDKIVLQPAYDRDSGIYACDYMLMDNNTWWNMRTIVRVNVTTKDSVNPPIVLDPPNERNIEVELGQPLELKCQIKFGFQSNASSLVQWYREICQKEELVRENRFSPNELGGETFLETFWLEKVTEKDLCTVFKCLAKNSAGKSVGVFRLKRRNKTVRLLTLCCAITILLGLFFGSVFAYQHWIEIVLLYRNYLAKDETIGDNKEFDAFVSYAKPDFLEADQMCLNEEQFALEVLPHILENKYGYKLCLTERDILPGGAYTDDIVHAIKRSRRTVVILSPSYVNGPAMFEFEAAVKTALEDTTIKIILVQFKSCRDTKALPHKVKKALRILPRITWEMSTSPTANKHFWKKLRYLMPVKHIKVVQDSDQSSYFPPTSYWA